MKDHLSNLVKWINILTSKSRASQDLSMNHLSNVKIHFLTLQAMKGPFKGHEIKLRLNKILGNIYISCYFAV